MSDKIVSYHGAHRVYQDACTASFECYISTSYRPTIVSTYPKVEGMRSYEDFERMEDKRVRRANRLAGIACTIVGFLVASVILVIKFGL
jgi:hypothetical protein